MNSADWLVVMVPAIVIYVWVLLLVHIYVMATPEGFWRNASSGEVPSNPTPPPATPKTQAQKDEEFYQRSRRILNQCAWGGIW